MALSPTIAAILRLPTGHKTSAKSTSSIAFSGDYQVFYVTTNFTEPQIVNNSMEQIVATVVTGDQPMQGQPQYVPVNQEFLSNVDINIVSTVMQPVRFIAGSITLTVHFRKAKS